MFHYRLDAAAITTTPCNDNDFSLFFIVCLRNSKMFAGLRAHNDRRLRLIDYIWMKVTERNK